MSKQATRRGKGLLLQALALSLAAHGAIGAVAWAATARWRRAPAVQHVMVAKVVQLGPKRPSDLLPEKAAPPPAAQAVPTEAPAPTPAAEAAPKAQANKANRPAAAAPAGGGRTRAALERLKQRTQGSPDGSLAGDADEAEVGDAYAAEIYRCLKAQYVIEGVEAAQVAGCSAIVLLYVQADGRISRHKLLETSGQPAFDQATSRAVRRCAKVSPPPALLQARLREEGIEIKFQP